MLRCIKTRLPPVRFTRRFAQNFVQSVEKSNDHLRINWTEGPPTRFHYFWLRDNSLASRDPSSNQKLHSSADVSLEIQPKRVTVTEKKHSLIIDWEDGHQSEYSSIWLRKHAYDPVPSPPTNEMKKWNSKILPQVPVIKFSELKEDPHQLNRFRWMRNLAIYGLCRIEDVPKDEFRNVAQLLGPLKETMYGPVWNVIAEENPSNLAYTSRSLPLHQDLCYYESPPGIQLLHCLINEAEGGANSFVDGFHIVELLREKNPQAFKILQTTPIRFEMTDPKNIRFKRRPLIEMDSDGQLKSLYHSPPWEGPLRIPFNEVKAFYEAYKEFVELTQDRSNQIIVRTEPGHIYSFDNRRVFHSRDQYKSSGKRHLQGCYVDSDDFYSTLEVVKQQIPEDKLDEKRN